MRPARPCAFCGRRPVAFKEVDYCFACHPGGPVAPPPCRRCGSTTDYYSAGLCSRCHHMAPQQPGSCLDCGAWGVTRHTKWLCIGCLRWRRLYPVGRCRMCEREVPVNPRGLCRLCRPQWVGRSLRQQDLDPMASLMGQQLSFAGMPKRGVRGRPGQRPDQVRHPDNPWVQLSLFPRDVSPEAARRRVIHAPLTSALAVRVDAAARDHARLHGWSRTRTKAVRLALRVLLALHEQPTVPFRASDVGLLRQVGLPVGPVRALLAQAGLLEDDRLSPVDGWFDRKIVHLPEAMVRELRVWFRVLLEGSPTPPRLRPRSEETVRLRLLHALPALDCWARAGYESLSQISRREIVSTLPPGGTSRAAAGQALRSIFKVLKGRRMVFINPTMGVPTGRVEERQPLPAEVSLIREALCSPNPVRAAIASVVVFHGLRSAELRGLLLTDVRDGRIHVGDRHVALAEPARARLRTYLDYRMARWPRTANPHLFITSRTAVREVPVGRNWLRLTLGTSVQRLREDRILYEAQATRGDSRRLTDLFGIGISAALRYANTVDHPGLAVLDAPLPDSA